MKHPLAAVATAVLLAGCLGCADAAPRGAVDAAAAADQATPPTLRITGSSTMAPLLGEIGKRFQQRHPAVRVEVQTGGSSRGVADARRGLAEIGMVSRALGDDESDLHAFGIASDGVCIIVHADNPVGVLSDSQVAEIYRGTIDNWMAVGGNDQPIIVVNKAQGRSTLEIFSEYFGLTSQQIQADVVIGDNQQGIKTVAGNTGAIGYVSIGTAQWEQSAGTPIRLLPTGGVEPLAENVARGLFPISRPLNLVTRTRPTGLTRQLIEFAQSPEVHDLIEELSFVPLAHR